jgi:hypothetical protein
MAPNSGAAANLSAWAPLRERAFALIWLATPGTRDARWRR